MRRLRFLTLIVAALCIVCASPSTARASLRVGCVGSDDIGVPGVVGWTDAGLLFQTDLASAPKIMIVTGPDGAELRFTDGVGLQQATAEAPFWLAAVPVDGEYQLMVDGYDCIVEATGTEPQVQPVAPTVDSPPDVAIAGTAESRASLGWEAHSAPLAGN